MRNVALKLPAIMVAALLVVSGCGSTTAEQASAPSPASAVIEPNVKAPTEAKDTEVSTSPPQIPEGYTGPRIEEPAPVPACPYHEEVGAVQGVKAQVDLALELGCEVDIYGEITFTEPLPGGIIAIISVDHAMSVQEMCDEGIINEEDCAIELSY